MSLRETNRSRSAEARMALVMFAGAFVFSGCAMSLKQYGELSTEVANDNERSFVEAEQELLRDEGLTAVPAPEVQRFITLSEETRARCRRDKTAEGEGELLVSRSGSTEAPLKATAALQSACDFYARGVQLEVTVDGEKRVLGRWPDNASFAKDRSGQLVLYKLTPNVVSTRTVTVKVGCDHMPGGDPGPFDLGTPMPGFWKPEGNLLVVERGYSVKVLSMKCTDNTY